MLRPQVGGMALNGREALRVVRDNRAGDAKTLGLQAGTPNIPALGSCLNRLVDNRLLVTCHGEGDDNLGPVSAQRNVSAILRAKLVPYLPYLAWHQRLCEHVAAHKDG